MYQAVYKCRLCGKEGRIENLKAMEIEDFTVENTLAQTKQSVIMGKRKRVNLYILHCCKDGSRGFADFQGFEKVEE